MDMEKRIKNHLINVYNNLTGNPSDFLIPMNILNNYITTEEFIQVYNTTTIDKKNRFGYGHKVDATEFPVFNKLRERFPAFKDYFYFLKIF